MNLRPLRLVLLLGAPWKVSRLKLFGDLSNCSIGHITVNIGPTFPMESCVDEEFDSLATNVDLDIH